MHRQKKIVDRKCFDFEKLNMDLIESGVSYADIANASHYGKDTVTRYLKGNSGVDILETTLRTLLSYADLKFSDYVIEEPVEEIKEETTNNTDVLNKLNELIEIQKSNNELLNKLVKVWEV